jgi:hypothetical protein
LVVVYYYNKKRKKIKFFDEKDDYEINKNSFLLKLRGELVG